MSTAALSSLLFLSMTGFTPYQESLSP